MEKNQNNYYVYEWIRLDTNEPFYIGKGCKDRWKSLDGRNNWFKNIVKKIPCVVNILHDNLSEDMANDLEVWYIREYRDIIGYPMCNIADGGEGHGLVGENNGMYGKHHTEEYKKRKSESMKGENNPMYGKSSRNYMTEESLKEWKRKQSETHKGKNNCGAKSVICLTTKRIFYTAKEGAEYYSCDDSGVIKCCKRKRNSCGKLPNSTPLKWMYLNDFLEQCEYTLL